MKNIFQWNFFWNSKVSIHKNAFENVICQVVVICLGIYHTLPNKLGRDPFLRYIPYHVLFCYDHKKCSSEIANGPGRTKWLTSSLTHCSLGCHTTSEIFVNTVSGNGSLPDGTKPGPIFIEAEWCIHASANLPSLVQIMACRLVGAKLLSEPVPVYC